MLRTREPRIRGASVSLLVLVAWFALEAVRAWGQAAVDPSLAQSDQRQDRKLRILVDKVLMAGNDWVMTADHVRQIAGAGFNVVCPRRGNEDIDEVLRVAALAADNGIRHMPWIRGTLRVDSTDHRQEVRLTWPDGTVQDLYSPNSDTLWSRLQARVVEFARASLREPAVMGAFFDFENYAPGGHGDAYPLSYDGLIMRRYAEARDLELPPLPPAERRDWLMRERVHEDFAAFQVESWLRRCERLRAAVDAINPDFRFCVHPARGTLFISEAVWPVWGTQRAPLILADAVTYGRPYGLSPHGKALQINAERLSRRQSIARQAVDTLVYLGGINPLIGGADPEFSGKNAVMISEIADGYWVFYEGPVAGQPEHQAYWHWFTWANTAIEAGDSQVHAEPRESPDVIGGEPIVQQTDKAQIGVFGLKPRIRELLRSAGDFEVHELGGISPQYLRQLDVVLLQNFNLELGSGHPWVRALREYAQQGGGLMLAHDTAWFMDSPVPEVAVRGYPVRQVEAVRHVVDRRLQTAVPHPALGRVGAGVSFQSEFRDHMIFIPGEQGTVIVRNHFGDAVYVLGEFGKGRVLFSGCYYGYSQPLEEPERSIFLACLRWLAR